jgi:hypothetical protein
MDRSIATVGALSATAGRSTRAIVIHDPVAGLSYALDPARHTGRSMLIPQSRRAGSEEAHNRHGASADRAGAKTEDLGTQVIQGMSAQGKRVTRAIPAGEEGNEKEIDIVTETWYSPDLQMVVQSKTSDPRFGDTVYQVSGLNRVEPDPALFTVPAGYSITESRTMHRPPAAQ